MPSPADPHLTLDQAADALGTNPDHITRLITTGQLDHTGHGNELRIPQSALIAYVIIVDAPSAATPVSDLSATVRSVPAPIISAA